MKKRIVTGFGIFFMINLLICLLSRDYYYYTVLSYFDFINEELNINFALLIFNVAYILVTLISISSLIEEKTQVGKYIQVRIGNKKAAQKHISRLYKEASLITLSKIISDFIFWIAFDRNDFKYFLFFSMQIYVTVQLWLILFDCLSNLKIKNSILILAFITLIYLSYLLLHYNDLFSLFIIKPQHINVLFEQVILAKILVLLLSTFADLIIRAKRECY